MIPYIIRRLLIAIPVLFGVMVVNFIIINMAPGNPVDMYVDPNSSPELLEMRKEQLGLNDPLYIQFFHWLGNLAQGNLGYSFSTYEPVSKMIFERLGPTFELMGLALLVGLIIALPIGILSAVKQYSKLDYLATGTSFFGISIPHFFLGLGLIYIFAVQLQVLPAGGMSTLGSEDNFLDKVQHLILPVIVLAVGISGQYVRYVRASLLEVLGQDYLRTARAKGLKEFVVTNKHALKNALIPIITIIGMEIPFLLGGAVITEQIFQWPGMGQLTIQSIMSRDYPTLMALNLLTAFMVLFANLLTDIVYSFVDPRIKYK
ncbi:MULTISPECIES: ABC transporter permease [Neobacillus]|uniref:ABC transporter permease n=1 Tax=Neobacillus citreus TaxID=2833578 RepID=A0A942SU27_9BACI|nr:ABC transporter permease [Neobacillus citreus]MCH6264704.1 ABC transporter permease [Neobacillus citreus]